jgi:hypothetical protein
MLENIVEEIENKIDENKDNDKPSNPIVINNLFSQILSTQNNLSVYIN